MKQLHTMEGLATQWGPALGLLFLLPMMGSAQTVVSSSGGSGSGGGHTLSWTIGEPVVNTVSAGNVTLT